MTDTPESGDLEPIEDTVDRGGDEDRSYDTLDEAAAAIREDDDADEEQPEEAQAEDEPEAEDETDSEEAADDEGEEEPEDFSDAVIELPNGETLTVGELEEARANGLRQSDYTQKTTKLASERKELEQVQQSYAQRMQFLETAQQNLAEFVQGLIPPEPPLSLAQSNPSEYQYQRAVRESAMSEVTKLFQMKDGLANAKGQVSAEDMERYQAGEREKLVQTMPTLKDPARHEAFRKTVNKSAVDDFGFTEAEATGTHDARLLRVMHYAHLGLTAERNRANAKRRVETPKQAKPKPSRTVDAQAQRSRDNMRRLSKSGSIDDAVRALMED